jgi:hypothetical protein
MGRLFFAVSGVFLTLVIQSCSNLLVDKSREKISLVPTETPDRREGSPLVSAIDSSSKILPSSQAGGKQTDNSDIQYDQNEVSSICNIELARLPGPLKNEDFAKACKKAQVLQGCVSEEKRPIFHYERLSSDSKGKKILALALIHGDELPSGSVARAWMTRLENVEPRNSWRVIPVLNPDGFGRKTRVNARGVDINRNFPTEGWEREAAQRWKSMTKSDPRRYPGPNSGSEMETRCAMKHIEDFNPDFIISIHTPLGVLDFDGPRLKYPRFEPLPWISLGNFPGSLGRYMWKDHNVPVLTIELKGSGGLKRLEQFDHLQDISGTVAIQSNKAKEEKN